MTNTWIDGGGVFADKPLPEGTRIRFSPTGDPSDDVQAFVLNGMLHVRGMWKAIDVKQTAVNALDVVVLSDLPGRKRA